MDHRKLTKKEFNILIKDENFKNHHNALEKSKRKLEKVKLELLKKLELWKNLYLRTALQL